ncbi:hypothetical protein AMECASPLE_035931 [Ameca splendens]|uniref:Uncharacterized protein n=1 Tax=Ameca splendens TaxID=208324 RepID=A0ABV0YIY8_9TELE
MAADTCGPLCDPAVTQVACSGRERKRRKLVFLNTDLPDDNKIQGTDAAAALLQWQHWSVCRSPLTCEQHPETCELLHSPPTRRGPATLLWSRNTASDSEELIFIPTARHSAMKRPGACWAAYNCKLFNLFQVKVFLMYPTEH